MELVRFNDGETLVTRSDNQDYIMGYGAVWYDGTPKTEYKTPDGYLERISSDAFDESLVSQDPIESRFNHDRNFVLGRSDLGSARFFKDGKGLVYQVRYDSEDPDHVKVKSKIRKSLIRGSSFVGYSDPTKIEIKRDGKQTVLTHKRIKLVEAGPVDNPAYKGTEAMLRSEQDTIKRMVEEFEEKEKRMEETRKYLDYLTNLK